VNIATMMSAVFNASQ